MRAKLETVKVEKRLYEAVLRIMNSRTLIDVLDKSDVLGIFVFTKSDLRRCFSESSEKTFTAALSRHVKVGFIGAPLSRCLPQSSRPEVKMGMN